MQGYIGPPGSKYSMTAVNRAGRRRPLPSKPFKKIQATASSKLAKSVSESSRSSDLQGMLSEVQQHIDMFQYEEARDVCSRAVLLAPEDADIRYQLGCICLELGDFQGGFENIRLSLNLKPETTPDRFFAFAQLIPGREAVQVYEHGLNVYSELSEASEISKEIKRKVSTACCAASEIFMTDLCDDEDAEIQCASWLDRASNTDPGNPEVFRVLADLRMCQEKPEEAREFIKKACSLWSTELERLINPQVQEDSEDALMAEFPSYESRISGAKILIELGDFDVAVGVLEQLLKEDDSVLMTWYLLGFALKSSSSSQGGEANLEDAIEGALRVARRDGHLLYPQMTSTDELVLEILSWYKELGMQVDLDSVEEDENEEAAIDLEEALKEAERLDDEEANN